MGTEFALVTFSVMKTQSPNLERGIVLIIALIVLALLVVISMQISYTTTIDLKLVRNQGRELKSYYAARGVATLAIARLREDLIEDGGLFAPDSYLDGWASGEESNEGDSGYEPEHDEGGIFRKTIGEVSIEYRIVDEARKICLNNLALEELYLAESGQAQSPREAEPPPEEGEPPKEKLDPKALAEERKEMTRGFIREILLQLDVEPGEGEDLVRAMEDGAPYHALAELASIDGITSRLLHGHTDEFGHHPGLADFLTLHSMGEVNINTASREVLIACLSARFPSQAAEYADRILDYRASPVAVPVEKPTDEGEGESQESEVPRGGIFTSVDQLAREIPELADIFGSLQAGSETEEEREGPDLLSEGERLRRQLTVRSRLFSVRVIPGKPFLRKEYFFLLKRGLTPDIPIALLLWEERELPPSGAPNSIEAD
ncbi:MAG: hypothetical protein O7H41_21670 [Planctomycetota bacterium]|nr:hypothetical protein [Planctomycetota bacterium]